MSRRRAAEKRQVQPDFKYKQILFTKIINGMMWEGKKSVAEKIFYSAIDLIGSRSPGKDPVEVVLSAVSKLHPSSEVRSRRVGGATYSVPIHVSPARSQTLAIRWLIVAARARPEKTMIERLATEILNASEETGAAFKRKVDNYKMAAANQAFAHYRW